MIFKVIGQRSRSRSNFYLVNTRINFLQWILVKLGTHLVLRRIWNPIDFQGHRSRSPGQIFRLGNMPRFALPVLFIYLTMYLHIPGKAYFRTTGQRHVSMCYVNSLIICLFCFAQICHSPLCYLFNNVVLSR